MDFVVNGITYQASKLDAIKQFHILRRLAPVISGLAPLASLSSGSQPGGATIEQVKAQISNDPATTERAISGLCNALSSLKDDDANTVLFGLLGCITRQEQHGLGWAPITNGQLLMYQDIDLLAMMQLAWGAVKVNFSNFLNGIISASSADALKQNGL